MRLVLKGGDSANVLVLDLFALNCPPRPDFAQPTSSTTSTTSRKEVLIKSIVFNSLIFIYKKFPNHCCSPMVGGGPSVGSKYEHQYCESWVGGNGIIVLSDC